MDTDKPSTAPELSEGPKAPRVSNEVLTRNEIRGDEEERSSAFERPENRFLYVVLAAVTGFILFGLGWYAATVSRTYNDPVNHRTAARRPKPAAHPDAGRPQHRGFPSGEGKPLPKLPPSKRDGKEETR